MIVWRIKVKLQNTYVYVLIFLIIFFAEEVVKEKNALIFGALIKTQKYAPSRFSCAESSVYCSGIRRQLLTRKCKQFVRS